MTKVFEPDQEKLAAWLADRPQVIKDMVAKKPPHLLYLLKSSNHRVTVYSYSEDGTMTVDVTGKYNLIGFGRRVFGIDPDLLEECDFPNEDEPVGETMGEEETLAYINKGRAEHGLPALSQKELEEIKNADVGA